MIEKNKGHIVTIASAAGLVGVPGLADYSASKHAAKVHSFHHVEISRRFQLCSNMQACVCIFVVKEHLRQHMFDVLFLRVQGFDESIRLEMRLLGKTGVKTTCVCPFYIRTGMFEGAQSRYPIILPLLQPEYAVKKIMQAIRCDQSVLIMPLSTHLINLMRALLPCPLFDEFCEWSGSLESMDHFKGRAAKPQQTSIRIFEWYWGSRCLP